MTDIVERLNAKQMRVHDLSGVGYVDDPDCREAAAEITRLRAQVAEQEAAIKRAVEAEREACAKVAGKYADFAVETDFGAGYKQACLNVAGVIRGRTSSPTPPNTQPSCANGGDDKPGDAR